MCLGYGRRLLAAVSGTQVHGFLVSILVLSTITESTAQRWVLKPHDTSVVAGGRAKFFCEFTDLADVSIRMWQKGTATLFMNGNRNKGVDPRYRIEEENNLVIDDVNMTDNSLYSCGVFGFDQVQVQLTVLLLPGHPVIASNSTSTQLVENSVISFTCSSTGGKPAPEVQWLRNGQLVTSAIVSPPAIPQGTSSSQIIVNIQRTDHLANYTCKVTNEANVNSSYIQPRILNVQYSPSLHFEPAYSPYHIKLYSTVSIRCVVDANPDVLPNNIHWTKDGQRISTDTSETLHFPAIQKSDMGNYACTATNYIQGTPKSSTISVVINVIYPPVVTTQSIVTANISTLVNMTCLVESNPPVSSIRWQKVGDTITSNGANFVFSATKRHAGNYTCTAMSQLQPSGSQSEQISSKGYSTLNVQYAPGRASINPTSSVLVGRPIMLTCVVDDPGYPRPSYEWRRVGNSRLLAASTSPVFRIDAARLSDNGNYTCLPRNLMGQGSPATILVEVNSPPIFTQSTPSISVATIPISQSNFLLQHKIEGRPLPMVQWYKDGVPLSTMSEFYKLETTHIVAETYKYLVTSRVLFIGSGRDQNSLRIADIGNYSCEVFSATPGNPTIKYTYLSIEFAPQITPVTRVAADIAERTTLKCRAQANPSPVFSWYKGSQLLNNNSRMTLTYQVLDGPALFEGSLQIQQTNHTDFGDYLCEVNNTKGHSRRKVNLSPRAKPEAPTNLVALSRTWESVKLQWEAGFNGGYDQTFFVHMTSLFGEKTVEAYRDTTSFNVTRLMPHTSYTFRVFGKNALGRGTDSVGFTTTTNLLVFSPLTEIPQFKVDDKLLKFPNELTQNYCLRVEVSRDSGHSWSLVEPCVPPSDGSVKLSLQTVTNVNVSVCLVYRPEVCGEPVVSEIHEESSGDLSESEVIAIGAVCAGILIVLLVILIYIICRRRRAKNNYTQDPHSPRTVQQGNGTLPTAKPHGFQNQDISGDPYYSEKPADMSFNTSNSPRTPTKDPQQFINVPEDPKREAGSVGSHESGYSTPEAAKPKKVIYEVVV